MAQIDQEAAREELEQASQLRAKAEQLIEIADELHQQADGHEHDALDLIAPAPSPSRRRRGSRTPANASRLPAGRRVRAAVLFAAYGTQKIRRSRIVHRLRCRSGCTRSSHGLAARDRLVYKCMELNT